MFTAIGQTRRRRTALATLARSSGTARIVVDDERRTSLPGVWAGGDCVAGGLDLTVSAVEDGKQAARSIDAALRVAATATPEARTTMVDLRSQFPRHQVAEPVLAGLGAADRPQDQCRARLSRRLGRRRLEDARRGRAAGRQRVRRRATARIHGPDRRLIAFNNIELITDRDLEINLREIKEVKREWPDRALVASLMVPCDEESWKTILAARRGDRVRRRRAQFRLSARHVASAAWARRSGRCPNMSRWSRAGARRTRACR